MKTKMKGYFLIILILLSFFLFASASMDGIEALAKPGIFSVGIMVATMAFSLAAVFSFVRAIQYKNRKI